MVTGAGMLFDCTFYLLGTKIPWLCTSALWQVRVRRINVMLKNILFAHFQTSSVSGVHPRTVILYSNSHQLTTFMSPQVAINGEKLQ